MYTLKSNITRWPKVFTVLVLLTVLDLVTTAASEQRSFLNGLVIVLTAVVAGIIYKLFAPVHAFKVAALLDRIEGRQVVVTEPSCDEYEEEFDSEEESEEETEEESDVEPLA